MILFRPHRGLLADSMDAVIEVEDKFDLMEKIDLRENIQSRWYAYDDRIGWDTWIVTTYSGLPLGFTNGDIS